MFIVSLLLYGGDVSRDEYTLVGDPHIGDAFTEGSP